MEEKERWERIPGYELFYKISTLGRVISLDREYWNGHVMVPLKGQLRKPTIDTGGYRKLNLNKNGVKRSFKVSILMGMTFFPEYPTKKKNMVIDHISNIKTDDRLINLQLITTRLNTSKDRKGGSSKYIGVFWHNNTGRWRSVISIDKKKINLGNFKSELEAAEAYKKALKEHELGNDVAYEKGSGFSSQHKGVSWDKDSSKWAATIGINGKQVRIGLSISEEYALNLYQIALENRSKYTGDKIAFRSICKRLVSVACPAVTKPL